MCSGRRCIGLLAGAALAIAWPAVAFDGNGDHQKVEKSARSEPVVLLVIPRPEPLIKRLTDDRFQSYLKLSTRYQEILKGKSVADLRALVNLVATQLGTTWDQALVDLAGGGIVASLEVDQGQPPRLCLAITARKPEMLAKASEVFLKLVRDDAKTKGNPDPVKTSNHAGVVVHALGGPPGIAFATVSGKLLISNTVKNVEQLIDRTTLAQKAAGNSSEAVSSALAALGDRQEWKAARDRHGPDTMVWGFADLARLRQIDPNRFSLPKPDTGATLLFGSWLDAVAKAPNATAAIRWSDRELGATVELPVPPGGRAGSFKGYVPEPDRGAGALIRPPGTIATLSLWRDWSTIWEPKTELFSPESVQGFAQLDTFAGQFFGVREFGPDVLGALAPHWRLVIASQDYRALKAQPDLKLPGFAIVAELNQPDSDFAQRLKVAFQTFVGISNVDAVQKKGLPLELQTETVNGITLATAQYMIPQSAAAGAVTPNQRYNFSPSVAQVGKHFILSTSAGLARALIKDLKSGAADGTGRAEAKETAVLEADGPEFARLLEANRGRLAMRIMLDRGETKEHAESEVELLIALFRYLRHGRMAIRDDARATSLELSLQLSPQTGEEPAR
jgi:hypothetical protein